MTVEAVEKRPSGHVALISLDRNLLSNVMGLPPETLILNAFMDGATMEVFFLIESPDLPEVPQGTRPPVVHPIITTIFDWGIEKKDETRQ